MALKMQDGETKQPKSECRKRHSIFKDYSENATVHGLNYITDSSNNFKRRFLWAILFLGSLCGLIVTLSIQFVGLFNYPTLTQQSVANVPSLPFPAVTLCNLNQFPKSLAEENDDIRNLLLATSSVSYAYIEDEVPYLNSSVFEEVLDTLAPPVEPTLQKCSWDNVKYDCADLFFTSKTDFGFCFTFNGRNGSRSEGRKTTRPGTKYGLTVISRIFQEEYSLSLNSESAGLRVILHDHNETPLVEGRGFDVSPGHATKGSLSLRQVNNLPPPYTTVTGSSCVDKTIEDFSNPLQLFDEYDANACVYECRYNYVFKECKCRSLFDPGNDTLCDSDQMLYCYDRRFEEFMEKNLQKNCSCPVPCEWNIYTAQISMSSFPSLALMEQANNMYNISLTEQQFRQDYLKLTLAFDDLQLETITQVPKFPFESIISTVGGQMGIFLGASLLSVVEFLEFLYLSIVKHFHKPNHTKVST